MFSYKKLRVNCIDISKTAIALVKKHKSYDERFVDAHKCDIVNDPIPFPNSSADFSLFLFVLSALSPSEYLNVIKKLGDQMK